MATEFRRIQNLRGTTADWASNDIVLLLGEIGLEDTGTSWRGKVGNGTALWSALPYAFEIDPTARASIVALEAADVTLDGRVTALETGSGSLTVLTARVDAHDVEIAGKQDSLPPATAAGILLQWDGTDYAPGASAPTDKGVAWWDNTAGEYKTAAPASVGQFLRAGAGNVPTWQSGAQTIARFLTYPGGASVQAAFNAAAPTVLFNELVFVRWTTLRYLYIGPPGVGITGAVAGDFLSMDAWLA